MKHNLLELCLSIILYSFCANGYAQNVISGSIMNDDGNPLGSVIIKLMSADGKEIVSRSMKNGSFSISAPDSDSIKHIKFSKLGYEPLILNSSDLPKMEKIVLHRAATSLREVTVKAPSVRVKGDTISYNLADFAGKGDVTLQDALKKVPGMEVEKNGGIKYNGKSISNFYINGMDLLGGKYNIATTSLPHSYVSAVEVLNNHQDIKIDKKIFNDNVALNIRLKPKAMFKPVGKYEATAGYGDRFLGELSGAGMMFTNEFQTILTLKAGNIKEFATTDNIIHYISNQENISDYTAEILGKLSGSTPPVGRERWINPDDFSVSLNFVNKLSKDASLRTNIGYEFTHTDYDYSESASYYDGSSDITINRMMQPSDHLHKPSFSIEYKLNSDNKYLSNELRGDASFSKYNLPVSATDGAVSQYQEMKDFNVKDYLGLGWRKGKTRWNFNSFLNFKATPEGEINISRTDETEGKIVQKGRSYSFCAKEDFSAMIEHLRSRITFPLSLQFNHDRIHTNLDYSGRPDSKGFNNLNGSTIKIGFSPSYDYQAPYNRFVFRVGLPLNLQIRDWSNNGSIPSRCDKVYLETKPSLYINYEGSSKSTFRLMANFSSTYGDMLDLLTSPVMTDYISVRYKSGIISHKRSFDTQFYYAFKSPVERWNANVSVGYNKRWNNLMSSQSISQDLIAISNFLSPNASDSFSANMGISKQLQTINTKISLNGSWTWGKSEIEQNDMMVRYYTRNLIFSPNLTTNPFGWFELNYRLNLSLSTTRFISTKRSYSSQIHDISLKFFPSSNWEINMKSDITRKEITSDSYKTMTLFDVGAAYKFKSIKLGFQTRNVFNCKEFSYTILNGLDNFSYNYSLRGREFLLSITFIK